MNMKPNLDEDDNPSLEINWLHQHALQARQRGNHYKTSSSDWKELETSKQVTSVITTEMSSMETNSKDSSSPQSHQVDQIKSAKAKMDEVKQENERLKKFIEKIMKDYQTLQTQFHDIVGKKAKQQCPNTPPTACHMKEEEGLLSLSLGMNSTDSPTSNEKKTSGLSKAGDKEGFGELGLKLRLDRLFHRKQSRDEPCTNSSPKSSTEEAKQEDEAADAKWPPSKIMKKVRSGEDELLQQNQLKKARVSVRVRCSTSTINDGCQWRKYGQKIAKGNPCPRAYYRCTISPSCPVRKQVQRCLDDMTILTTTYEGIHDHPLPISATAMATTTSAAVSMLQSGSSSSTQFPIHAQTSMVSLNGMNFNYQNSRTTNQFYFTNSSISSYNSHPTVTLDLTSSPSSHFNSFPLNFTNVQPSYTSSSPSTSFNFSSSSLASGNLGYVPTNIVENDFFPSRDLLFQPNCTEKYNVVNSIDEKSLMETRARTATHAKLESDPAIQSALAAAITLFAGLDRRGEEKKV